MSFIYIYKYDNRYLPKHFLFVYNCMDSIIGAFSKIISPMEFNDITECNRLYFNIKKITAKIVY